MFDIRISHQLHLMVVVVDFVIMQCRLEKGGKGGGPLVGHNSGGVFKLAAIVVIEIRYILVVNKD